MKDSIKTILKMVYSHYKATGEPFAFDSDGEGTGIHPLTFENDIENLIHNGYLDEVLSTTSNIVVAITSSGESLVENDFRTPQESHVQNYVSPTINLNAGGSISFSNNKIGTTEIDNSHHFQNISNQLVNEGFSELEWLISEKYSDDKESLQELIEALKSLEKGNQPVKRDFLAKFSRIIEKCSDIAIPIGKILVGIFIDH